MGLVHRLAWVAALLLAVEGGAHAQLGCPEIVWVVDHAASMAEDPGGHLPGGAGFKGPSKWEHTQRLFADHLNEWGDRLPEGLALVGANLEGVGGSDAIVDAACDAAARLDVVPSLDMAGTMLAALRKARPAGASNLGEGIQRAAANPNLLDNPRLTQVQILVTDGRPACNSRDRHGPGAPFTVGAIEAAAKRGIRTLVVSFDGGGVSPRNLDDMARAGGTAPPGCDTLLHPENPCYVRIGVDDFERRFEEFALFVLPIGLRGCDITCQMRGCPRGQLCVDKGVNSLPVCEPAEPDAAAPADAALDTVDPTLAERGCGCVVGVRARGGSAASVSLLLCGLIALAVDVRRRAGRRGMRRGCIPSGGGRMR